MANQNRSDAADKTPGTDKSPGDKPTGKPDAEPQTTAPAPGAPAPVVGAPSVNAPSGAPNTTGAAPVVTAPPAPPPVVIQPPPPVVSAPPPEDPAVVARRNADRAASDAAFRAKAASIYDTLQNHCGLSQFSASLLAAHMIATYPANPADDNDRPEHLGRTQILSWVENFQRLYPIVWFDVRVGNLNGWVAKMDAQGIEHLSSDQYNDIAAVIRG